VDSPIATERPHVYWIAALIVTIALQAAGAACAITPLERPIRIEQIAQYTDGGTTGIRLRGTDGVLLECGYDGRLRTTSYCKPPRKLFIGAMHPSYPGARLLDLLSDEETQLLEILWNAAEDSLGTENISFLREVGTGVSLPDSKSNGAWSIARGVAARFERYAAYRSGYLARKKGTLRYFGFIEPVDIASIEIEAEGWPITVRIVDSSGNSFTAKTSEEPGVCCWVDTINGHTFKNEFGCTHTGLLMNLILIALERVGPEARSQLGEMQLEQLSSFIECCRDQTLDFYLSPGGPSKPAPFPCLDSD